MLDAIAAALRHAGWRAHHGSPKQKAVGADLLVNRGKLRLAIELKAIAEGRADRLIPLWSQAWLQAQQAAVVDGRIPVAIVGADRVSPNAANALLEFIRKFAPDASGGVMDLDGLRNFVGNKLDALNASPALRGRLRNAPPSQKSRGNLFSDLNQWMLKVLLAPRIPNEMLHAPRQSYLGASALAAAAGVSVMSASRLLRELQREGYLDDAAPHLKLVRLRDLLSRWKSAVSAQPLIEQPWRAVVRGKAPKALDAWMAGGDACWALFGAAQQQRIGFVEGVPPYAYVKLPAANARLAKAGFVHAGAGDVPDVIVRQPRTPESVFRGMVSPKGRPSSDIIQVWLDVSAHPSRGEEQAALIWRKVFEPLCAEESA